MKEKKRKAAEARRLSTDHEIAAQRGRYNSINTQRKRAVEEYGLRKDPTATTFYDPSFTPPQPAVTFSSVPTSLPKWLRLKLAKKGKHRKKKAIYGDPLMKVLVSRHFTPEQLADLYLWVQKTHTAESSQT